MSRWPSGGLPASRRESPEQAVEILLERGYDACEIDFESGFWMDYHFAERLGELARASRRRALRARTALRLHGSSRGDGRKWSSAVGALDRSAGIAAACGAAPVVFHPGFLLGRTREDALDSVVEQLGTLRARLEEKGRAVPFGVEVMGRVRDLGSLDDVLEIATRVPLGAAGARLRPHARDERRRLPREPSLFAEALEARRRVLEPDAPFHIHFSDIQYANRNETKHLPYGEGTLRAEPLRDALARFDRPATVISESPDEASSQAIRSVLARA